eukprot:scaffold125633_cov26-Tisochrysis_lutea.AAC.1
MDPKIVHLAIGKGLIKRSQQPGSATLLLTIYGEVEVERRTHACQTIFKIFECSFDLLRERRPFRQRPLHQLPVEFLSHIKRLTMTSVECPPMLGVGCTEGRGFRHNGEGS